jgi:hypothetical protein
MLIPIYEKLDNQLSTHKSLEDLYLLYKSTQHRQSCLVTNNHHFVWNNSIRLQQQPFPDIKVQFFVTDLLFKRHDDYHTINYTLRGQLSRKYGPEDCDSRWPDQWPDQESQVKGPHFLLLTLQRVINCFIITLFSQYCKFIGKPPNTNSNAYFDRTWT